MQREFLRWAVGIVAVVVIALSSAAFTVREQHTALVTRFGRLQRLVEQPGLHWKWPWPVDRAVLLDGRTRVFETRHSEMLTRDKKNIILLGYAVWRIAEPVLFYKAVGSIEEADKKLDGIVTNAKIGVLGRYDLAALVSTEPADLKGEEIEREILASVSESALAKYGIEVQHVGFKRLSLPAENIESVFNQMRAERQKVAAGWRAQGERDAAVVRSETDLEAARIKSEAREQAAQIKGEAEAQAARIYADSHGADPDLFLYLRELESLTQVLGSESSLILRTDAAPFRVLNGPDAYFERAGAKPPAEGAAAGGD